MPVYDLNSVRAVKILNNRLKKNITSYFKCKKVHPDNVHLPNSQDLNLTKETRKKKLTIQD